MIKQPMLAAKFDSNAEIAQIQMRNLRYPVLASPKLDGIRAHIYDGTVYSRKNKPIPNHHVQNLFGGCHNFDGELICGNPTASDCFNKTSSGVMSYDGEPEVFYYVFDLIIIDSTFEERLGTLRLLKSKLSSSVKIVPHRVIYSFEELMEYEADQVEKGYEGVMIRDPKGLYKQGRSTLREGWLIKVKRFEDSEAEILGVYEQETNLNEATINEVGKTKRSSHKANKHRNGHLGGFYVRDIHTGVEFDVGTLQGFTKDERKCMWENNPEKYIGRIIKYKFFPVGVKDKPRHPIMLGFRSLFD